MLKIQNFINNGVYMGAMNIISRASGLILNIFLVRMLTPDGFGVFALFQNLMEKITGIIRVGGLETSTHVLVATSDERNNKPTPSLLSVPLLFRLIFCLIFAALFLIFPSYMATNILKQPALIPYMHFFVFTCVAGSIEVLCEGVLKGLNLFKSLSKINVAFALFLLLLMPSMTYFYSLTGAIFAFTFCTVSRSSAIISIALIQSRRVGYVFSFHNFFGVLLKHLKIGLPTWLPVLIVAPVSIYVISLLTSVAGIDDMAYYRVIVTCGVFIQLIPHSLLPGFITVAANESNQEENISFFHLNLKFTIFISVVSCILLLGIMPLFISIVFGSAYALAVKFFLIYAITMVVINCANIFSSFLVAQKYANALLYSNTSKGILFLITGMYLIPLYGLPGFLMAEFIAFLGALIGYIIFFGVKIQGTYSIKYLLMRIIPFIIMAILATLAINFIQPVIIRFSVSAISAILLVYVFWKITLLHEERMQLKNYLEQLPFYKKFNIR
ncbi:hypothetical protein OAB98_04960 [Gammaproteobacteria bacterium]|nr:hypothetical protein [Gammaproteobacteria bacterium]